MQIVNNFIIDFGFIFRSSTTVTGSYLFKVMYPLQIVWKQVNFTHVLNI